MYTINTGLLLSLGHSGAALSMNNRMSPLIIDITTSTTEYMRLCPWKLLPFASRDIFMYNAATCMPDVFGLYPLFPIPHTLWIMT